MEELDIASLAGMLLGVAMFLVGVFSGGGLMGLRSMFDLTSIIITLGGSISGTLGSFKLKEFISGLKGITLTFKDEVQDPAAVIKNIIDLSNTARKEGLLALEEAANGIEDEFLKKGIMLVVDGTDPELVRGIMETDLMCIEQRHKKTIAVWEKWAELGPAWGMIGTLIGLILMLKDMQDASTIGPKMAVALVTTLYGSLILSIQAGENPRVIEEKLKSFLAPSDRNESAEGSVGGEE